MEGSFFARGIRSYPGLSTPIRAYPGFEPLFGDVPAVVEIEVVLKFHLSGVKSWG